MWTEELAIGLTTALKADAQLQAIVGSAVHADEAPEGTTFPHVVFRLVSGVDHYTYADEWYDPLYLVKAVDKNTNPTRARQAADRIHAVLMAGAMPVAGHTVFGVQRVEVVDMPERIGNEVYRHAGGVYRIWLEPA